MFLDSPLQVSTGKSIFESLERVASMKMKCDVINRIIWGVGLGCPVTR